MVMDIDSDGGCGGMGGCMQVTIINTSRKKKKEKLTYWHRQAGGHRQKWVQGEKCGHAQTGACRWAQGGVWRHGWAHAGYKYEYK